jgi:predicted PurR-regulated permease PerM
VWRLHKVKRREGMSFPGRNPSRQMEPKDAQIGRRTVALTLRGWLLGAATISFAVLLWLVVANALSAFLLLFTAILLAEGLRPSVNRLAKRVPGGVAILAVLGSVLLAFVTATIALLQPLGSESSRLLTAMPDIAQSLQSQFLETQKFLHQSEGVQALAASLSGTASALLGSFGQKLLGGPALLAQMVGDGVLIILLTVAWLMSAGELSAFVLSLLPPILRERWGAAFDEIGVKLGAYVQGVVINGIVVGVATGIALALLGIPYALLLGFVAAIFQAIPLVGAIISGPIIILAALATAGWTKALFATGAFIIVQLIDQNALSPIIFGQRVQLSFLLIVFSTVLGGTLLGIAGAFLAVPAAAALQVIIVRIVAPAIRSANKAV